jgi:hypothetical protein
LAVIESVEDGTDDDLSKLARNTDAARDILIDVARAGTTITYGSLAERIVEDTGIEEQHPINSWIGNVLAAIAKKNHEQSEPLLSSLVVRASDGYVGEGYLIPVRQLLGDDADNGEEHAALQRVRCYRLFAANSD